MKNAGITPEELAKKTKFKTSFIKNVLECGVDLKLSDLVKIALALDCEIRISFVNLPTKETVKALDEAVKNLKKGKASKPIKI